MLFRLALLATLGAIVMSSKPAHGCGFRESAGKVVTLREDAAESKIILFARLEKVQGSPVNGTADLAILKTIKGDPTLGDKKVIQVPRFVPIDPKNPPRFLVFGDVYKGEIDFFRLVPGTPALLGYFQGILAVEAKDRVKAMRYCFDFLEHADPAVAADAFTEFIKSTDSDIRKAGRTLSAEKLRRWLQNDKTLPSRIRLYAFLLANCGKQQDTVLLKKLIDKFVKQDEPPLIDGVLTAYALLSPKDGWAYVRQLLRDSTQRFQIRYSALRTTRYFYTSQPEAVAQKELLGAIRDAMGHADMADIPMEYLRQWKCWQLTDQILSLYNKKGFEAPLIRRCILRYALQSPDARSAQLVAAVRKEAPSFVEDQEELLRYEAEATREKR